MSLPLELPKIQNWSCHNCGGCCRQHAVSITEEERLRIVSQNWTAADGIPPDRPLIERMGLFPWSKWHRLGHQPDGACVFLDERGLCRIHAKFGEQAKPLACRIYPYAFHPAGKRIAVSVRFSCPSIAANRGRSIESQQQELKALEKLVVPAGAERIPAPELSPGRRLDWPDTLKIVAQLDEIISAGSDAPNPDAPGRDGVGLKLVRALRLVDFLSQSRFGKITGQRLDEFLQIIAAAAAGEAPADLSSLPEPSAAARMPFRLLCAQYARRDTVGEQNSIWRSRWRLFRAAVQFARGTGLVPRVQEAFAEVPFADLEQPFGPLPADSDKMLTRYLRVKLKGLHFCGPAYYNAPLIEGFQSLALVVPVVLWLARWLAVGAGRRQLEPDDVLRALTIADHHHGYSLAFGQRGFRGRVRLLARMDEIVKLTAWYSR